jgi:2-methylcitrate dehydratase
MTLAKKLARFAVHLRYEDLPAAAVHEVKRRVIDSLGCALGAWRAAPCIIARRVAGQFGGTAALWGTRQHVPPDWAAFANGCLVRYLDFNDTYLSQEPAHPSDNIPAAFAIPGRSGRDVIAAIALAYEVQCRLCDAASLRARGWDHVTYVAFSSTLAAAKLLRLDAECTQQALNIVGVAAGSLRQSRIGELSHWKAGTVAHAARRGVFAALLAKEGMTGPAPIFEGEKGFEQLVSGPLNVTFNDNFMILKTHIKFWPAEYHSQSAIEAALRLRKLTNSAEIESVLVKSHDAAVDIIGSGSEKWHPTSREAADHSLPFIVAAALTEGEITTHQFDRLSNPLLERVTVERDARLSARYPEAVANIVSVRLRDGRTLTERIDYPKGHARNPLTDAEVETKFRVLADRLLRRDQVESALDWLWRLDEAPDVSDLYSLIEVAQ